VSGARTHRLLLRTYPPAWRARYGEELAALMSDTSGQGRVPWRTWLDVALAGTRERLRAAGVAGDALPPSARSRAGSILVLCAWALFVVGGLAVQRVSEHWQAATPAGDRAVPSAAFTALTVAAAIGTALMLAGAACALPALTAFLRSGGWTALCPRCLRAAWLTAAGAAATTGLVVWAHRLTPSARNGHDTAYAVAFAAWGALMVACLAAWTLAAVTAAQRIDLPRPALGRIAWLAAGVSATMAAMTVATAVWWSQLPAADPAAGASPLMLCALLVMLTATALGIAGARRALTALPAA
jgi:hypothetical protein